MSLNTTPGAMRKKIAFFGKTNSGKSTLINKITGQRISVVSDIKGTTTDPVSKAMELLPFGPVTLIDTAGFDDESTLGKLRVERTSEVLNTADIAIFVTVAGEDITECERNFLEKIKEKNIKYITVKNKSDLISVKSEKNNDNEIYVSAKTGLNTEKLKDLIAESLNNTDKEKPIVSDLVNKNDIVILITPVDSSAPKGRLILPQQTVLRELLDKGIICLVMQPEQLEKALNNLNTKPALVITDSQAFKKVNEILPQDTVLTSFSILFARYKGILKQATEAAAKLKLLNDGDKILISEGCTHHRQCEDIGTVKLPRMIKQYTGKTFNYGFSSGTGFPEDLSEYKMIIHCGGCMLHDKEVQNRYRRAEQAGIPISNYGVILSEINGILNRTNIKQLLKY